MRSKDKGLGHLDNPLRIAKTPGSLQINLLFTMYAEQALGLKASANFYFFKGYPIAQLSTPYRPPGRRSSLTGPSPAQRQWRLSWQDRNMVELSGIEPLTPCLQSRCSPSWATAPHLKAAKSSTQPEKPMNGGPGQTRTADLTLIRRAL
jgi:hypothetical protein